MTCEFSSKWDNEAIIDWDPNNDTKGVEYREGGCWNFKAGGANMKIHKAALQHKEVAHLTEDRSKDNTSGPNGKQPYDGF